MEIKSKALYYLEQLKIPFTVRGREAYLNDYDSLKISLDNKHLDSWKRYSTGESGKSGKDLITYLLKVGIISKDDALTVLGAAPTIQGSTKSSTTTGNSQTLSVQVEDIKPFDSTNQVYDPKAWNLKRYLTEKRKINQIVVDALINKHKIIEVLFDSYGMITLETIPELKLFLQEKKNFVILFLAQKVYFIR